MENKFKKGAFLLGGLALTAAAAGFVYYQNNALQVTRYEYVNEELPFGFDGYKILHISDLHNKNFGADQYRLVQKMYDQMPDAIVITGDLIDSRRTDFNKACEFIRGALLVAPVYYVAGNHEFRSQKYENLVGMLTDLGVTVLDQNCVVLKAGEDTISLMGMKDPAFYNGDYEEQLAALAGQTGGFKILLSHRPEKMDLYAHLGIDLVFAGHAHGGQVRLPGVGGLLAPHQGFFPKYSGGMYRKDKTTLVVSRGLGNSAVPVRVFNRPQLVTVTLHAYSREQEQYYGEC